MKKTLTEGVSSDAYHFTGYHTLESMLKNDSIELTPTTLTKSDNEFELSKGKQYYLSTTSSKSFVLGYQGTMELGVRVDLDGYKLMSDFKVKRVAFFSSHERGLDRKTYGSNGYDEMEDRVISNRRNIQFSRYVKSVTLLDPSSVSKNTLWRIIYMCNKRNITIFDGESNAKLNDTINMNDQSFKKPNNTKFEEFDTEKLASSMALLKSISQQGFDNYVRDINTKLPDGEAKDKFNEIAFKEGFITDAFNTVRDIFAKGIVLDDEEIKKLYNVIIASSSNILMAPRESYVWNSLLSILTDLATKKKKGVYKFAENIANVVVEKNKSNREKVGF